MKDDKFKRIYDSSEDNFLIEDDTSSEKENEKETIDTEELRKIKRKKTIKRYTISFTISFAITILVFIFGLFWQDDFTSLMAIGDSLWLVFALWLTVSWVILMHNYNLFSPLIHGTKTFLLMFAGKRPKEDYYTFMQKIKENPTPKFIIIVCWVTTLVVLVAALTTLWMIKG